MCGLFGVITTKPTKLNKTIFNVLGVENDTRGGDSCGIFIDGEVEYGVNENKYYSNFFKTSKLLKATKKCSIALGHCRKASVGVINETTAQPIVLTNDDGKIEFVVMHNGTIYNYKELARKYIPEIDITNLTDSQVMARIFYYKGYDVLNEYYGGAVFVIVDYRENKPKILLWKGASKQNSACLNKTEERPFKFTVSNDKFIFSSLGTYLEVFSNDTIYTLIPNNLIEVCEGDVYSVAEYKRDDVTQSSYYPKTTTYFEDDNDVFYSESYYYDTRNTIPSKTTNTTKETVKDNKERLTITDGGLYEINNQPASGVYNVDSNGNIVKEKGNNILTLYFWDGVLLYGIQAYCFLKNACRYYDMLETDVKYTMCEVLNYLSPYPIAHPDYTSPYTNKALFYKSVDTLNMIPYMGTIHRFLMHPTEHFINGNKSGNMWKEGKDGGFYELKRILNTVKIDMSNLYKELYATCS